MSDDQNPITPIPPGSMLVTPPAPIEELTMPIGVKEIYDTGVETKAAVKQLSEDLHAMREEDRERRAEARKRDEDVENRLRSLEKWRYGIGGAVAIAVSALGYAMQLKGGG